MRAKILYKMGKYDEAEEIYRKMLSGDAPYPFIHLNLALVKFKRNQFDEAIDIYSEFIEKHGDAFPYEAERAEQAMDLLKHSYYYAEPNEG
jgi:tetratricopeptide (TPR) repeat protein